VNLAEALASAASMGMDRLDAQLLLLHTLARAPTERAWLLAHDTDELAQSGQRSFMEFCERRAGGEPLAYIVGHKEFFGLDLQVDQRVLVPRPETETLVEWALEILGRYRAPCVVDLGTGSGAIALALKHHCPGAQVTAVDSSAAALEVARQNAGHLQLDVGFALASWLAGTGQRFDVIVSNPPYVAQGDPHLADLTYEPLAALVSGLDGLQDIRSIVGQAPAHLRPGGWLLLEHGYDQAEAVRELLAASGLQCVASRRDLAGIERCSGGQRLELG
jgi:release factor glutamine methyltransferase